MIQRERPYELHEGIRHPGCRESGQGHPRSPRPQRGRKESKPERLTVEDRCKTEIDSQIWKTKGERGGQGKIGAWD